MMKDIFITNIKINKVRHLENIEIKLSEDERKHLILTGRNGSGKTSVLEQLNFRLKLGQLKSELNAVKGGIETFSAPVTLEFSSSTEDLINTLRKGYFIIAFFVARRQTLMDKPPGPRNTLETPDSESKDGKGRFFLQYLVNLQAEKAFARDDGDTKTVEKIEQWFTMFENTLRELFEDETLQLQFDRKNFNFSIITKNRKPFDFNTLADGYSAAINILCDLIIRIEKNRNEGYEMQGIVLIDEIETHLHVELQKKILPFLTKFFPRIQFIVSTHSPFVLNSLDNAVIYDLENQIRVENLSPYSYEAIVERYFDVDKYSDHVKQIIKEYEILLDNDCKTETERFRFLELRNYLKKVPVDFAPELVAHFQSLELQKGKSS